MDIVTHLQQKGIGLTAQQYEAAFSPHSHLLLLAVPGAGKTTVLTVRLAHMLSERKILPQRILVLTYNREAARDMDNRWQKLFDGTGLPRPSFVTIHSFCYRLLREYAAARRTQLPRLLEGGDPALRARVLSEIYRRQTGAYLSEEKLGELEHLLSFTTNALPDQRQLEMLSSRFEQFSAIRENYRDFKRQNRLMDFDDMLLYADTALERYPALLQQYQSRYDALFVDEVQDISRLQYRILCRLAPQELFLVGDEDQSIYGFRGADPQIMLGFQKDFPQGAVLKLEENHRSSGAIVQAASILIKTNRTRFPKEMYTARPKGTPMRIVTDLSMAKEPCRIAGELKRLAPQESCAVLYRVGVTGISTALELEKQGIAYSVAGAEKTGISTDPLLRELLSIMALAEDPTNEQAFRRCYYRLGCSIPKSAAERAADFHRGNILQWILEEVEYDGKRSGRLAWAARVLARMRGKAPFDQFQMILRDLEYLTSLEKRRRDADALALDCRKLLIFEELCRSSADISVLAERLSGLPGLLQKRDSQQIFLSTVHSAKGREYDHVIIADAVDGIFPSVDAIESAVFSRLEGMEEETRLFYTAITRARKTVTIFSPGEAYGMELGLSRFVRCLTNFTSEGKENS